MIQVPHIFIIFNFNFFSDLYLIFQKITLFVEQLRHGMHGGIMID